MPATVSPVSASSSASGPAASAFGSGALRAASKGSERANELNESAPAERSSDRPSWCRGLSRGRERDIGVLITDHNVRDTLDICETAYIVGEGHIIAAGTTEEVLANRAVREVYLGEQFRM